MPSVNKLYTEFKSKGLEVLLISFRENPGVVKRTAQARGYVAPVVVDRDGDLTGRVYGVWGPPTAYFVDRRGQLIGRIPGPRRWDSPAGRTFILALLDAGPKR